MDVKTFLWSKLENKERPGQVCNKKYESKLIACEFLLKRVVTFGVVLYRNHGPINFNLHFAELQIGGSIKNKNALFGKYFLNCKKVKIILVSFNCFSEYIFAMLLMKWLEQLK